MSFFKPIRKNIYIHKRIQAFHTPESDKHWCTDSNWSSTWQKHQRETGSRIWFSPQEQFWRFKKNWKKKKKKKSSTTAQYKIRHGSAVSHGRNTSLRHLEYIMHGWHIVVERQTCHMTSCYIDHWGLSCKWVGVKNTRKQSHNDLKNKIKFPMYEEQRNNLQCTRVDLWDASNLTACRLLSHSALWYTVY